MKRLARSSYGRPQRPSPHRIRRQPPCPGSPPRAGRSLRNFTTIPERHLTSPYRAWAMRGLADHQPRHLQATSDPFRTQAILCARLTPAPHPSRQPPRPTADPASTAPIPASAPSPPAHAPSDAPQQCSAAAAAAPGSALALLGTRFASCASATPPANPRSLEGPPIPPPAPPTPPAPAPTPPPNAPAPAAGTAAASDTTRYPPSGPETTATRYRTG